MSTTSAVFIAIFGVAVIGGLVLGLVQVGTAEEPTDSLTPDVVSSSLPPTSSTPSNAVVTSSTTSSSTTSTTVPSTSTSTSAVTTTTLPAKETLVINGTGDVNLDPRYIGALAANGYGYAWAGVEDLFQGDDLTVINLECAPTDIVDPQPKTFVFRCPTESLQSLVPAGVEVANLGNNHSGDHGPEGLVDGRAQLIAAGVAPVGAGKDLAEAGEAALFEVGGWTVAVVGFGGVIPAPGWLATEGSPGMRSGDDLPSMVDAVAAAAELADLVVVTIHWGVELDTVPRPDDIERAAALIEAGADVIFGHHSHRLQPLEMVNDSAVFWGLGNFVWPRFSTAGATTGVGRAVIRPDGSIEACLIPAFIENSGQPVLTGEPECGPGR